MKLKSEDRYDKIVPGDVRSGLSRLIEIADLAIKDQAGNPITELKIPHFPGAATEIEFTLQKLKYDESQGLKFSFVGAVPVGTAVTSDTLFLGSSDFEGYEVFKSKRGDFNRLSSIIKLSDGLPTEVKQT
ncbi:11699_t:CDS:2 [Ambispora leptoticha]|uniref:11699_t:CDS:1 n=1 Tax=Ambispora leptoticha TaxID=144679 RepID=A0A9N9HJR5_9GLOM|nr:11699_t:CDS:2 [Ambispora leptoticha]